MDEKRSEFNPGDQIGKYAVLSLLGFGELCTVYLAEQQFTRRRVALNVFDTRDEQFLAGARREAELLASIDHPSIVRMFDADEYEGRFYHPEPGTSEKCHRQRAGCTTSPGKFWPAVVHGDPRLGVQGDL